MKNASTYTREIFVVTESIMKFLQYFLGRKFLTHTDHQSFKALLT